MDDTEGNDIGAPRAVVNSIPPQAKSIIISAPPAPQCEDALDDDWRSPITSDSETSLSSANRIAAALPHASNKRVQSPSVTVRVLVARHPSDHPS